MACEYCRSEKHSAWCPFVIAGRDPGRTMPPAQPIATEDWARGVLVALKVPEQDDYVSTVREALVALHRRANVEGVSAARRHIPQADRPDVAGHRTLIADVQAALSDKPDLLKAVVEALERGHDHQSVIAATDEHVSSVHAEMAAVGVELPVGTTQPPAR